MQDDILSLLDALGINDLFELMNSQICSDLNTTDIVQTISLVQSSFSEHIARCINLANNNRQYQQIRCSLERIKCNTNQSFVSIINAIKFCIERNSEQAEGCFDIMMHDLKHDLFLETMSGQVPRSLFDDGRYMQIFRLNFGCHFYRIRRVDKDNCNTMHPDELFHLPYHLRHCASMGRYSTAEFPTLYLATNIDVAVSECGNPQKYFMSEYQSNYTGYEFSNFNDPLEVVMLALYHPLAVQLWMKVGHSDYSFRYWFNILKCYLETFPLTYSCSMKGQDNASENFKYFVPQLLMKWIAKNKQFCDGVAYFPKALAVKNSIDSMSFR